MFSCFCGYLSNVFSIPAVSHCRDKICWDQSISGIRDATASEKVRGQQGHWLNVAGL
jgi:hypothetical protein